MEDLLEILKQEAKETNIRTGDGKPINAVRQETFIDVLNSHISGFEFDLNNKYGKKGYLHVLGYKENYFCTLTCLRLTEL